jgi:hypothetical protein
MSGNQHNRLSAAAKALVIHKLTNCVRHGRLGYNTNSSVKMVHGDMNFGDQTPAVTTVTAMLVLYLLKWCMEI